VRQISSNPAWQSVISNVQFNAFGAVTSLNYLGLTESRQYNLPGQMTQMTKGSLIDAEYRFSTTANDGRILSQKNWLNGEDVVYAYDELDRLISASTTAGSQSWGLSWTYDGFGNRLAQGAGPVNSVLVNANTNRISSSGYNYDANGNMTLMPKGTGSMTMDYDLSNRLKQVTHPGGTEQYGYAPDNRRVWRSAGRTALCSGVDDSGSLIPTGCGEAAREQLVFYSPGGQKMGGYGFNPSKSGQYVAITASEENVFYGGRLVGKRLVMVSGTGSGLGSDFTADRLQSKGDGSRFYPYGESKTGVAGDDREQFATYTRDGRSGLDYADQRWYASGVGRFVTPDPFAGSFGPKSPSSANRYHYADDDPANYFDPSGLFLEGGTSRTRTFDECYLDGRDYCRGNIGVGGGGPVVSSPHDIALTYGLISLGQSLNASTVNWGLLLNSVALDVVHGISQSAHLTVPGHLAGQNPSSFVALAATIPILVEITGGLINATGAMITVGILWQTVKEFLGRGRHYDVWCHVHTNGGGSGGHEAVARLQRSRVYARSRGEAISLVRASMVAEMKMLFGETGFHLQHCGAN